ncbi:hypothetical protein J4E93_010553 [Alternaria ventricosa]|uniref:uncharacterized protein n=1 Tax=Alternaria ventricosa TaxID=1187951 RepID=UPI0020C4EEB8|nr:uncharacterized protein J4E93_010553 [Alternaria ventricosa]KAI4637153.1 hypothetical protein J4E93_010553 [Alternaria ventricosa]
MPLKFDTAEHDTTKPAKSDEEVVATTGGLTGRPFRFGETPPRESMDKENPNELQKVSHVATSSDGINHDATIPSSYFRRFKYLLLFLPIALAALFDAPPLEHGVRAVWKSVSSVPNISYDLYNVLLCLPLRPLGIGSDHASCLIAELPNMLDNIYTFLDSYVNLWRTFGIFFTIMFTVLSWQYVRISFAILLAVNILLLTVCDMQRRDIRDLDMLRLQLISWQPPSCEYATAARCEGYFASEEFDAKVRDAVALHGQHMMQADAAGHKVGRRSGAQQEDDVQVGKKPVVQGKKTTITTKPVAAVVMTR